MGGLVGRARRIAVGESRRSIAVGSFESSERGRTGIERGSSERHRGKTESEGGRNETQGRTSSLKTGDRGTLGGWGDLALRGNAG